MRRPCTETDSNRWHHLATSASATSLIEHALLLGAIACAAISGIHFADDLGVPVFSHLARVILPAGESSITATDTATTAVASRSADTPAPATTSNTASVRPIWLLLATAAAFAGLWAVVWYRRRRRQPVAEEQEAPESEPSNRGLHAKRRALWENMLTDPELLLKNRAEVQHLMTRKLRIIAPRTARADILDLMTAERVRHLLVCDSEGDLLGIISDRDMGDESEKTAERIMTADPITVSPRTTVGSAITTLLDRRISCLPVVHDGIVRGILTTTDLVLSLQCMMQWWLRFTQSLARAADYSDKIDSVHEAAGRRLFEQRVRLETMSQQVASDDQPETGCWDSFSDEAQAFLDTAGELIAMQAFEGDRLAEMSQELLHVTQRTPDQVAPSA